MLTTYPEYAAVLYKLALTSQPEIGENEWTERQDAALASCRLTREDMVPAWLIDFFTLLLDRKESGYVDFDYETVRSAKGGSWISFAEQVLPGDWEFEGEYWSVFLDVLGMTGYIYYEGESYATSKY